MRRWLMLLCLCGPAMACLNDSEVARQDAEFHSSYADPSVGAIVPASQHPALNLLASFAYRRSWGGSSLIAAILWRGRPERSGRRP